MEKAAPSTEFGSKPNAAWMEAQEAEPEAESLGTPPGDFVVILDRQRGENLEIVADLDGNVKSLRGDLVRSWNCENPWHVVGEGCRIVEVNGIRDDMPQMLDECKNCQVLEFVMRRSASKASKPPLLPRKAG